MLAHASCRWAWALRRAYLTIADQEHSFEDIVRQCGEIPADQLVQLDERLDSARAMIHAEASVSEGLGGLRLDVAHRVLWQVLTVATEGGENARRGSGDTEMRVRL